MVGLSRARSRRWTGRATEASWPAEGDDTDAAGAAGCYPIELPITFEGGAGLTRLLGREGVRFTTDVALAGGQRLAGLVRLPADGAADGAAGGIVLRFVARVAGVRPPEGPEGVFEVSARFERLDLVPDRAA